MNTSTKTKPSIVFCHGIWADGSCFNKVIPALQADGYEVMAAQYGLDTNEGDVATVKRTLGRVSSPAILVGHSYGGAVITDAATNNPDVKALVYVNAFAPDAGETVLPLAGPDSALAVLGQDVGDTPVGLLTSRGPPGAVGDVSSSTVRRSSCPTVMLV